MALKTPLSNFANVADFFTNTGSYDTTTMPSNEVKITASSAGAGDLFGKAVAIGSGRIVIGAPGFDTGLTDTGAAYLFNLDGSELKVLAPYDPSNSYKNFGNSVAVGCDRIVIGAPGDNEIASLSGAIYIFDLSGNLIQKVKAFDGASGDSFGNSVAVGSGRIVVGAHNDDDNLNGSGSAYIFDLNGNLVAKINASDPIEFQAFGYSVAIGSGRIVIGAYRDDDRGQYSGSAYIFDLNGTQLGKITASDGAVQDYFGRSVAVGNGRIIVGSYYDDDNGSNSGSAYIFDLNGNLLTKIKASDGAADDYFGWSVAVGNGRIVVSADSDDGAYTNTGSAYVFDLNGNQLAKITASDGLGADYFSYSVSVGSGRIVCGAYASDGAGASSGSAYIFTTPSQLHFLDAVDDI